MDLDPTYLFHRSNSRESSTNLIDLIRPRSRRGLCWLPTGGKAGACHLPNGPECSQQFNLPNNSGLWESLLAVLQRQRTSHLHRRPGHPAASGSIKRCMGPGFVSFGKKYHPWILTSLHTTARSQHSQIPAFLDDLVFYLWGADTGLFSHFNPCQGTPLLTSLDPTNAQVGRHVKIG